MRTLENKNLNKANFPDSLPSDDASISLDRLTHDDSEEFFAKVHDNAEHLARGGLYHHLRYRTIEDLHAAIDLPGQDVYAIRFNNDEIIGDVRLADSNAGAPEKEASIWVAEDMTGKGIAGTALRAVVQQADQRAIKLSANIQAGNTASRTSFENQGFVKTHTIPAFSASTKAQNVLKRSPSSSIKREL